MIIIAGILFYAETTLKGCRNKNEAKKLYGFRWYYYVFLLNSYCKKNDLSVIEA